MRPDPPGGEITWVGADGAVDSAVPELGYLIQPVNSAKKNVKIAS